MQGALHGAIRLSAAVMLLAVGGGTGTSLSVFDADDEARLRRVLDGGAYADAAKLADEWSARVDRGAAQNPAAGGRWLDLLVEAKLKNGEAAAASTLEAAERAVKLREAGHA